MAPTLDIKKKYQADKNTALHAVLVPVAIPRFHSASCFLYFLAKHVCVTVVCRMCCYPYHLISTYGSNEGEGLKFFTFVYELQGKIKESD